MADEKLTTHDILQPSIRSVRTEAAFQDIQRKLKVQNPRRYVLDILDGTNDRFRKTLIDGAAPASLPVIPIQQLRDIIDGLALCPPSLCVSLANSPATIEVIAHAVQSAANLAASLKVSEEQEPVEGFTAFLKLLQEIILVFPPSVETEKEIKSVETSEAKEPEKAMPENVKEPKKVQKEK